MSFDILTWTGIVSSILSGGFFIALGAHNDRSPARARVQTGVADPCLRQRPQPES